MTEEEILKLIDPQHHATVLKWLDRGDGIAAYQNHAMDSSACGHRKFVSYGSPAAQLEVDEPPARLPDVGSEINWPYRLEGTFRRSRDAK